MKRVDAVNDVFKQRMGRFGGDKEREEGRWEGGFLFSLYSFLAIVARQSIYGHPSVSSSKTNN